MPEWLSRLTPKQRLTLYWGLSFLVTTAILSLFFFLLYKPKLQKLASDKQRLEQLQADLVKARNTEKEIKVAKVDLELKVKQLKKLELSLPEEEYVPTLLEQIENLAAQTNAQVASLAPSQIVPAQPLPEMGASVPGKEGGPPQEAPPSGAIEYRQISLNIPFVGGYGTLLTFLQDIAKLPVVIVINSLSISKSGGADPNDGTPLLNVSLPAVVFILPKGNKAPS